MPVKPDDTEQNGDFLSRWSKRKRSEAAPAVEEMEEQVAVVKPEQADDELTDAELLEKLELPDPDSMKQGDDFSAFMKARVPERLRRRALRNLWVSNPVLANLDELLDYGEDFTDAACVIENMQTVYEVGKGAAGKWEAHLAKLREEKAEAKAIADAQPQPEPALITEADDSVAEPEALAESAPEPVIEDEKPLEYATVTPEHSTLRNPRRMRFEFD